MPEVSLGNPTRLSQWLGLYRLYQAAFPASERKPFSIIVNMYRRKRSDVWCIGYQGKLVGLAATINSTDLVLLDYFAIDRKFRGSGIGSAAMSKLQKYYCRSGLFVEIESTREPAENHSQRLKRKHFYQKAGMEELNVEALVFGVRMELLGSRCKMNFDQYRAFYREHYNRWAAENIKEV